MLSFSVGACSDREVHTNVYKCTSVLHVHVLSLFNPYLEWNNKPWLMKLGRNIHNP